MKDVKNRTTLVRNTTLLSLIFSILLILPVLLTSCATPPTGQVVSQDPLNADDEQRVLEDINPYFDDSDSPSASASEKLTALADSSHSNNPLNSASDELSLISTIATNVAIPKEYEGLPRIIAKEGELVTIPNLKAVDPDGDLVTYFFSAPLDDEGKWQTYKGDQGLYVPTITATDGKGGEVDQQVLIIIEGSNQPPLIADFEPITITEGDLITFVPDVYDPDGDEITITYSGWITSNEYLTSLQDAGTHIVTVTATDGIYETKKDVTIKVLDRNRPPQLGKLESEVTVKEGDTVIIEASAIDPDGDPITISYGHPLTPRGGEWYIRKGAAGDTGKKEYDVRVTASDGQLEDVKFVKITVLGSNNIPVIEAPSNIIVEEGDEVSLASLVIYDPDGDEVQVTYTGWMHSLTRTVGFEDAGSHTVTVTATDGKDVVSKDIIIQVREKNRSPRFNPLGFEG